MTSHSDIIDLISFKGKVYDTCIYKARVDKHISVISSLSKEKNDNFTFDIAISIYQ